SERLPQQLPSVRGFGFTGLGMSEVGWPSLGLKRPWRAVIPVFPAVAAEARGGTVHPRTFSGRHDLAFRIAGATA
ncbi:MAG: hypothetical protein ACK49R_05730, partial [Planctomycetota bacterium]